MNAKEQDTKMRTDIEIEATDCPECGTNWEVVITQRPRPKAEGAREE